MFSRKCGASKSVFPPKVQLMSINRAILYVFTEQQPYRLSSQTGAHLFFLFRYRSVRLTHENVIINYIKKIEHKDNFFIEIIDFYKKVEIFNNLIL